jgi:hypothetical protein
MKLELDGLVLVLIVNGLPTRKSSLASSRHMSTYTI